MTTPLATHDRNASRTALFGAALALGFGTLLGAATPADARDEFKNGFEHEFGRIVAHGVAALGHSVLAPAIGVHREIHHARPRHHARRDFRRWHHRRHRERYRHHHRHHRQYRHHRGQRHGQFCGHAHARAQRTAIREHGRGNRHERYDSSERRPRQSRHERHSRYEY
ncbi:MAG: hypothetical protein VX681_06265 [Myxococcota bacterium]|nr:hypothetical protein [Myxococcota bacterium]